MSDWLEAEQRIERAQQLCESRRWAEALKEIDAALSINPHNAAWHAQRGILLEELNRFEDAADAFENAADLDPEDRDVQVAYGAALIRLGRYAQAITIFDQLARLYPDFEPAYCHRVQIYAEIGQHEQAEEMFYIAQQLDEYCPHCFFHMGASLAGEDQTERAIFCWKKTLEIEPSYLGVYQRIAQAYRNKNDLKKAREYLIREIRNDPGNIDLLYEMAELTFESGQTAAAAAKFGQIVELDPYHAQAHYSLGKIWIKMGQPAQALACFETAQSISGSEPVFDDFNLKKGEALIQLGRYAEAKEPLEMALEDDKYNLRAAMLLGDCQLADNNPERALDGYRRVLAHDAHNPFAHHKLGICLFRTGEHENGLYHCLEAVRSKPDYGPAMYNAVVAHLRLGQFRSARAMLKRAVRNEPSNADLQKLNRRFWRYRFRYYFRAFRRRLGL